MELEAATPTLIRVLQFTNEGGVYISTHPQSELTRIEEQALAFVRAKHPRSSPPKRKETCLAEHRGKWCRGNVERAFVSVIHGTLAEVLLVDYGQTINVPLHNLVKVFPNCPLSLAPPLAECFSLSVHHEPSLPSTSPPWSDVVIKEFTTLLGTDAPSYDGGWGYAAYCTKTDEGLQLFYKSPNGKMVNFNDILISRGYLINNHPSNNTELSPMATAKKLQYESLVFKGESTDTPNSTDTPTGDFHFEDSSDFDCENISSLDQPTLTKYMDNQPKTYSGVFVDGSTDSTTWNELKTTPFPTSVVSSLKERGFRHPTAIQAHAWPSIWQQRDTILLSPSKTGKTLAYLLPLLCLDEMKRSLKTDAVYSYEPLVIVLVSESYKAWLFNNQTSTVLSWINAALRFRSCASYFTSESDSICRLLNGSDVLVATPPSLMRMINSKIITLTGLRHLVLDDIQTLFHHFSKDINAIMAVYQSVIAQRQLERSSTLGQHVIACASKYEAQSWKWAWQYLNNPVTIVTNSIELIVLKGLKCRVIPSSFPAHVVCVLASPKERGVANSSPLVVCVSNDSEAMQLIQILSVSSIIAFKWDRGRLPLNGGDVAVVKDDTLSSVEASPNIKHLVHYLLPSNKNDFTRRLTLLHPSMKSDNRPTITIIVNDDCVEQSKDLVQLLERLDQPVPEMLSKLAEEKQRFRSKYHKLYTLCPYLKAYGKCLIRHDCKMGHSISELKSYQHSVMRESLLPQDGVVKVKVEHVTSPVQIWVKVIDHTPFKRGSLPFSSSDSVTFAQLSLDLALYYSSPIHRQLYKNPQRGDICGLREPTGECYRALILDFSSPLGLYFHHKEQAKVRLIDTGDTVIVDANQLLTLPERYLGTPPLIIEAFICGLIPMDGDIDWPPESISIALKLFKGCVLVGRVALSYGNTLWIDPIEERVTLNHLKINTALFVPQTKIINEGLASPNPGHLTQMRKALNKSDNEDNPMYKDCRKMSLPDVTSQKVLITSVESSSLVWVQQANAEVILESINDRLNPSTLPINGFEKFIRSKRYQPGDLCAAKFPHDRKWYRAVVHDVRDDVDNSSSTGSTSSDEDVPLHPRCTNVQYFCLFVDYGDWEWVWSNEVEPICKDLLEYPLQAVECSLPEIDKGISSEEFTFRLWELSRNTKLDLTILPQQDNDKDCVQLLTEDGRDIVDICATDWLSSDEGLTNERTVSETMTLLLLIQQREVPVSHFLAHIISNQGKIAITNEDVHRLSSLIKQSDINQDIIKGVSLLLVTQSSCVQVFSEHSEFCKSLMYLVKNPESKDTLLSTIQLVHMLCLESSLFDVLQLTSSLLTIILSTDMVNVLIQCLGIIAYFIQSRKTNSTCMYSIIDKLLIRLPKLLEVDQLIMHCVKLLCLLIDTDEDYSESVLQHLELITSNAKTWPMEVRELFFYYARLSSNVSIRSHFRNLYLKWIADGIEISSIEQTLFQVIEHEEPNKLASCLKNSTATDSVIEPAIPSHISVAVQCTQDRQFNKTDTIKELTPKVLWSQTRAQLCLSVKVNGCIEEEVRCIDHTLSFKCIQSTNNTMYSFKLQLFGSIQDEKSCSVSVKGNEVVIKIVKDHDMYWPRVSRSKHKPSFICVDYDRWHEESSSSSDNENDRKKSNPWNQPVLRVTHSYQDNDNSDDSVLYDDVNIEDHEYTYEL